MDLLEMKRRYGKTLAFWGCLGTQSTMPFGIPREVKEAVREIISTVGEGGGLVIAPTHVLEPDVPWENITAFIDAVDEFGSML